MEGPLGKCSIQTILSQTSLKKLDLEALNSTDLGGYKKKNNKKKKTWNSKQNWLI
jgi:hypothetical protein